MCESHERKREMNHLADCPDKDACLCPPTEQPTGSVGRDRAQRHPGLSITGSDSAVLQLGETEGSHVDVAETGFRLIREDGEVELVEVGGSGGRVIRRVTDDEAR